MNTSTPTNFVEKTGFGLLLLYKTFSVITEIHRRGHSFFHQLYRSCIGSLGVTMIVALFIGMILSLQTGIQLAKFQQEEQVGVIVIISMVSEMGPMMTAIILAATMGSAIASTLR